MGYRRALLGRWSRRDRLAVLVVAVTVAFLTGATLLVLAAGGQTAAIAAELDSPAGATYHGSVAGARGAAPPGAVVLPVAEARTGGGRPAVVVGVPPGDRAYGRRGIGVRGAGAGVTRGDLDAPRRVAFAGREATVAVTASPRPPRSSILPPRWYAADAATVERLGPTGAFVVRAADGGGGPAEGAPLVSALPFFVAGTRQVLAALGVAVAGGALVVAVTVFSVTRMSVRDRLRTVRVARATGGRPARVLGLFALRALGLTALGTALGYAAGVVVTSAAVNVAVAVGLPTSLAVRVTPRAAGLLVPAFAGLLAVGALAGAVAAWPAVRRPPARLTGVAARTRPAGGEGGGALARARALATPALLDWRALVPSAATLAAFVAFVALVSATAGVAGPLVAADGATVADPDSAHPVSSQVPEAYADALRARGIAASPEILLFEVVDGEPVPARGADFGAFANVTDAELVEGRAPRAGDEAVVGADLARTLGVAPGDRLTLGGSTRAGLARVTVVGTFEAPGPFDDQLVVPLSTARHLSTVGPGRVNFVRAERLPAGSGDPAPPVGVVGVDAPDRAAAERPIAVRVTVENGAPAARNATVRVRFRDRLRRVDLRVPATGRATATVEFDAGAAGPAEVRAGTVGNGGDGVARELRVVPADALAIRGLPARAPPGSAPLVRVVNATGTPVAGATVAVGNRTVATDEEGRTRVPLRAPGERLVEARRGDHGADATVVVAEGAPRDPAVDLRVDPAEPGALTRPRARVALYNPWNRAVARNLTLAAPGGSRTREVRLAPGERGAFDLRLPRRPPGEYELRVDSRGRTLARGEYRVSGDERIASALAAGGRAGTTGVGRAIEVAFGNLRLVLGALVGLAGLMTVGGTTATFARAVHARRRTIGVRRATGAGPLAVLRLVLADAVRIGTVATVLALACALAALRVLDAAGYLVVYGVRLSPVPSPAVLAGTAAGALALVLLGAGLATAGLLRAPPAALLAGERAREGRGSQRMAGGARERPGAFDSDGIHADGGEADGGDADGPAGGADGESRGRGGGGG